MNSLAILALPEVAALALFLGVYLLKLVLGKRFL